MKINKRNEKLEKMFKALAFSSRIEILKILRREDDLPVWYIAEKADMNIKTASKHLRILLDAEIIDREQHLNEANYSISSKTPALLAHIIKKI